MNNFQFWETDVYIGKPCRMRVFQRSIRGKKVKYSIILLYIHGLAIHNTDKIVDDIPTHQTFQYLAPRLDAWIVPFNPPLRPTLSILRLALHPPVELGDSPPILFLRRPLRLEKPLRLGLDFFFLPPSLLQLGFL